VRGDREALTMALADDKLISPKGEGGRCKMTICVSVRIPEGLILAADSAVTLEGTVSTPKGQQTGILQTFDYANKITRIKDYPIGVMTWGVASISDRSIQSLIMEWEHDYPILKENENFTVREVADDLQKFIVKRYDKAYPPGVKRPQLGFFVGGYSYDQFFSDQYQCGFPNKMSWQEVRPKQPDGSPSFGANWFGKIDALSRLVHGYDRQGMNELIKRGADKDIVQKWIDDHVSELPLVFDGMPLQDAIDFANYAVQLTIGRFRFTVGPPLCGGNVDIAVITPFAFQWAQRKQWTMKE
jgi:hypothetical protein